MPLEPSPNVTLTGVPPLKEVKVKVLPERLPGAALRPALNEVPVPVLPVRPSAESALPVPMTDGQIDARFRETMRAAGLGDGPDNEAYIRILVTRGIGELTYDPAACPTPSVVVTSSGSA